MTAFLALKMAIALIIFFAVNLLGGISVGLGYTQIHYQFKRERFPAFNQVFKIITPVFVTIILALIFHLIGLHQLNKHIWVSLVLSWIIRFAYIVLWQRHSLMNIWIFFTQFFCSSIIAIWLYNKLIDHPELLFPSRDNMVSQIWLISILFLYKSFEDLHPGESSSETRKIRYIVNLYTYFSKKYRLQIKNLCSDDTVKILVLSIIVVENYNRPKITRLIERAFSPFRKTGTYGLMQVKHTKPISDAKSLELGIHTIESTYKNVKTASDSNRPAWQKDDFEHLSSVIHRTAWLYNNSDNYADEVLYVYNQITKHIHPAVEQPPIEQFYNSYFSRYNLRT